jgi:hypothetical protein
MIFAVKLVVSMFLISYAFHLRMTEGTAGIWTIPAIVAVFWLFISFGHFILHNNNR